MFVSPLEAARRIAKNKKWLLTGCLLTACCFVLGILAHQACTYLSSPAQAQLIEKQENRAFTEFTREIFVSEVSANTLTLHYTLQNPTAYGIAEPAVTLGNYTPGSAKGDVSTLENTLSQLHAFSYEDLSAENRLTYDILDAQLNARIKAAPYGLYEEILSPTTGTQAQLPVLLAEYPFQTLEDVDIYLELLAQLPAYYESLLVFEQEKSQAGLFMWETTADAVIAQCESFIENPEENFLITTFEERIQSLPFSSVQQKLSYLESNKNCVMQNVIPAYRLLIDGLTELKGTGQNSQGLCYYKHGKEYYESLIACTIGSSRSVPDIQVLLEKRMHADIQTISQILSENPGLLQETAATKVVLEPQKSAATTGSSLSGSDNTFLSTPVQMLETLEEKILEDFPPVPDTDYHVKQVHASLEKYLSPAFYLTPPIDAADSHTIYINKASGYDTLSLFTTLAHEGYPGHLYQSLYETACEPDPVRSLLYFGGYTEGWATYAERLSYSYSGLDKDLALLLAANNSVSLGIYARADIGIHYNGWSLEETKAFLEKFGIDSDAIAENIFQAIRETPGNYLKYYLGYVEIEKLKETAQAALKDRFRLKEFHRFLLSTGPAPFSVLEEYMQPWIEEQHELPDSSQTEP